MAKQDLDLGVIANDNTGDTLRAGGQKINQNFVEIYSKLGDGTDITLDVNTLKLDTLNDVDLTTNSPVTEQYLQFNGVKWVPVTHEVDGRVTGHLVPDANVTWDLGSSTHRFRDLYLSNNSLHLGNIAISAGPNGIEQKNVIGVYDMFFDYGGGGNVVYANSGVLAFATNGNLIEKPNPRDGGILAWTMPGVDLNTENPYHLEENIKFTISYRTASGESKTFTTLKTDKDYVSNPPKDTDKAEVDFMTFGNPQIINVYNREPLIDGICEELKDASAIVLTITKEFVPAEPEPETIEESTSVEDTSDVVLFQKFSTDNTIYNGNWDFDSVGSYASSTIGPDTVDHFPGLDVSGMIDVSDVTTNFVDNYPSLEPGVVAEFKILRTNGSEHVYTNIPDHRKTEADLDGFIFTGFKTIRLVGPNAQDYYTQAASWEFTIKQSATSQAITGSLVPDTDIAYDLGSPTQRFRDLYISGSTIHFGTQKISEENGQIRFSAPLAPFEEGEQVVYHETKNFSSSTPKQIAFRKKIPGVKMDIPNRQTTLEEGYEYKLKIDVADGSTTPLRDYEGTVVQKMNVKGDGTFEMMYGSENTEIMFLNTPGGAIKGVTSRNLRDPDNKFIGYTEGVYGELILRFAAGADKISHTLDSFQNLEQASDNNLELKGGPTEQEFINGKQAHTNTFRITMNRPNGDVVVFYDRNSPYQNSLPNQTGGDAVVTNIVSNDGDIYRFFFYNASSAVDQSPIPGKQYKDYYDEIRGSGMSFVDSDGVTQPSIKVEYISIATAEEIRVSKYHPLTKDKPVEYEDYYQFTGPNSLRIVPGTRSNYEVSALFKRAKAGYATLTAKLITNEQTRTVYELTPALEVYDANKSVSNQAANYVGSNTFMILMDSVIEVMNQDLIQKYQRTNYGTPPHGWFDGKKANLEFTAVKVDKKNKGDVLTSAGEQNLSNKTLGDTRLEGHIIPTKDVQFDLGSPTNRFRDLYISADSLNIGGTKLSTKGGSLTVATVESISKMIPDNKNSYFPQWSVGNTDWSGKIGNKITLYCGHPGDDDNEHDTPLVSGDGYDDSWAARDKPWNDNYNYSLFCDLKQQVTVHKEFPILEVSSPVAHPGWSVEPNAELSGSSTITADASGGDTSSQMLDITLRDLGVQSNQEGLFKLTYKFWNPKSTHISEQVSDYLIRVTPGAPPILETTSTTNLFRYWGNAPYNVKYTAYRNDGSVNENVTLDIVPSEVENNWVKSYIDSSWKFTEASDELDQIVSGSSKYKLASGDANTTPIFGFTLGNALQKFVINGVAFTDSLNFEQTNLNTAYTPTFAGANWKWDAADSKPLIIIHSIEKEGNDTFYYRLYAMENQTDSYNLVKDSDGQSAYNSPGFLTEFRFTDGFNQGSVLERTSRSRPLSSHMFYTYNNLYHQVLVQHDLPNKSSYNLKFACDYEFLSEMPWSDHQLSSNSHHERVFWQKMFYGSGKLEVDTLGAGTTVIPMPHLQYYTAQRVSYEKAVTHKYDASIRHERVEKWMVLEGMAPIDLNKYPFKKPGTPVVDFDDRYVLTARLYDSQTGIDQNKPFKEYKHLTKDKYEFEATGAVLHKAGDRTEGIVVDAFGDVTFKVRNPETFIADMSKCIKLKISLLAQPGIYTYKVGNSNDGYHDWSSTEKPYAVYAFANTYVNLFTTANTQIGSGADAALIYYHSDDAWFETYKKSEDPAVTSINTALIDTSNQLNAEIANTANLLSNSIETVHNLANSTAQTVTSLQSELMKALKIQSAMAVPSSNTAAGTMGDMVIDGNTVYIAVENNKWGRIALDFNF